MPAIPTPGHSPAGATAAEQRGFLRRRVAFYGRVGFIVSFGYWLVVNALLAVSSGDASALAHPANHVNLLVSATFATMWIICRREALPADALRAVEGVGTIAVCAAAAFYGWGARSFDVSGFDAVLTITNILVFRAVCVPSTRSRTLVLGCLAAALALLCGVLILDAGGHLSDPGARLDLVMCIGWLAVAITVSTITSAVIFGLRRRVREATRLGQYNIEERIGGGGMGEVYRASHALLRRPTAVKLLRPDAVSESGIARFEQEVRLTSMLTHPNTIAIYDYGRTADGVFYYAMEFLDGVDLESLVRVDGHQVPARVAHILRQACGSLDEAHAAGLVHRDVKPANLMLCQRGTMWDLVKVLDFGLVTDMRDPDLGGRVPATVVGTPHFIAPEAVHSPDRVDHRADVYALGAVAHFLLCGRTLFRGEHVSEILEQHVEARPPLPSELAPDAGIPAALEDLVMSCLEKDPGRRVQSARELLRRLAACDGIPDWTEAEARAWWNRRRDSGAAVGAARREFDLDDELSPFLPTIAVDVTSRTRVVDRAQ